MKSDTAIFEAFEEHSPLDPAVAERNLMRAMLRQAVEDLRKGGDMAEDAKEFFLADDDDYLFSFNSICRELNCCAETVLRIAGILDNVTADAANDTAPNLAEGSEQSGK